MKYLVCKNCRIECNGQEEVFNHIIQGCNQTDMDSSQTEVVDAITKLECNSCNGIFQPEEWRNNVELKCFHCQEFFVYPEDFSIV